MSMTPGQLESVVGVEHTSPDTPWVWSTTSEALLQIPAWLPRAAPFGRLMEWLEGAPTRHCTLRCGPLASRTVMISAFRRPVT